MLVRAIVSVGPPRSCKPAGLSPGLTPVRFFDPVSVPVGAVWNRLLVALMLPETSAPFVAELPPKRQLDAVTPPLPEANTPPPENDDPPGGSSALFKATVA